MCNTSSDCTNPPGVVKYCYEEPTFTEKTFFCDCTNWFGYVGERCDQETATLHFYRFFVICQSIWPLAIAWVTVRTLIVYLDLYRKGVTKQNKIDPVFYVLVLVIISAFLFGLSAILRLPALYDPTAYKVISSTSLFFESNEDVVTSFGNLQNQLMLLASSAMVTAQIQVILSWIKALEKFSRIFPKFLGVFELSRMRKFFQFVIPCILAMTTLLAALNIMTESAFFYIFLSILVVAGYTYGYFTFVQILKKFPRQDEKKVKALKLVTFSFRINLLFNIGVFISTVIYYILLVPYKNVSPIGSFNYVLIFFNLALLFAGCLLASLSYYAHLVTVRLLKVENKVAWVPKISTSFRVTESKASGVIARKSTFSEEAVKIE